jgi:hypothetical protein
MSKTKALKLCRDGAFRNIQHSNIITESIPNRQAINRLKRYIKQKKLTDSLNLLEEFEIYGDFALLIIGCLMNGGVMK